MTSPQVHGVLKACQGLFLLLGTEPRACTLPPASTSEFHPRCFFVLFHFL